MNCNKILPVQQLNVSQYFYVSIHELADVQSKNNVCLWFHHIIKQCQHKFTSNTR